MKISYRTFFMMVVSGIIVPFLLMIVYSRSHAQNTHTIQMGETLSEIAYAYGVPIATLADANQITNRDMIYAGQTVMIPAVYEQPVSGTVGDLLPAQYRPVNPMLIYIVQMGDTLATIADKFSNVTLQDVLAANNIFPDQSNYIQAGHRLAIPFQEE